MPSGTAVVDAFKSLFSCFFLLGSDGLTKQEIDLIRHGKNHHNTKQHQDDLNYHQPQAISRDKQQQPHPQTILAPAPNYKDQVEIIVQEEREAKNKMPSFKGLENFKLLDKMGEYVPFLVFLLL